MLRKHSRRRKDFPSERQALAMCLLLLTIMILLEMYLAKHDASRHGTVCHEESLSSRVS